MFNVHPLATVETNKCFRDALNMSIFFLSSYQPYKTKNLNIVSNLISTIYFSIVHVHCPRPSSETYITRIIPTRYTIVRQTYFYINYLNMSFGLELVFWTWTCLLDITYLHLWWFYINFKEGLCIRKGSRSGITTNTRCRFFIP